jgi:hypothetical protein
MIQSKAGPDTKTAYMIQPKAGPVPIIILKRLPWKKPK